MECGNKIALGIGIIENAEKKYCKIHGCELMKGVTRDGALFYKECCKCSGTFA